MRVMTTAGSSIPTSVLPRTNTCQYGSCTPVVHSTTTGANANAWPTVKSQRKKEVRGRRRMKATTPAGRTSTVMVMPATLGTRRAGQDPASTTAGATDRTVGGS